MSDTDDDNPDFLLDLAFALGAQANVINDPNTSPEDRQAAMDDVNRVPSVDPTKPKSW